jgi:hypothetical protein
MDTFFFFSVPGSRVFFFLIKIYFLFRFTCKTLFPCFREPLLCLSEKILGFPEPMHTHLKVVCRSFRVRFCEAGKVRKGPCGYVKEEEKKPCK